MVRLIAHPLAAPADEHRGALTATTGLVYGQSVLPWTDAEEELRKVITSVFAKQVGAVVFDNTVEGTAIRSAILAQLLTAPTWTDRRLGSSATLAHANDRAWMATGNNLSVGGDMPSRTVLVRLDPKTPKPEERTGFAIPDLSLWILDPANQRMLLWHLLAPKAAGHVMRQFTPWAQTVGALLAHHGVTGFLGNAEDVHGEDVDDAEWTAFLTKWATMPDLDEWVTTAALRESAMRDLPVDEHRPPDPWDGAFILNEQGPAARRPRPRRPAAWTGRTLARRLRSAQGHRLPRQRRPLARGAQAVTAAARNFSSNRAETDTADLAASSHQRKRMRYQLNPDTADLPRRRQVPQPCGICGISPDRNGPQIPQSRSRGYSSQSLICGICGITS